MIWDTGAHRTIIAEEILSPESREYTKSLVHDPYRSGIALISAVALVVPKTRPCIDDVMGRKSNGKLIVLPIY
jgi:hypothetical protein